MEEKIKAYSDDEIDLIELIKTLWDKKIWIILSTFVFTSLAGIYAFSAKEQWTSKAEVIEPRLADFNQYLSIRKEYARIIHDDKFDVATLSTELFTDFERTLSSLDSREAFFQDSELYKQESEGKTDEQKSSLLTTLVREKLTYTKPDLKKEPNANWREISFSAETPIQAQDVLKSYIQFSNQLTYKANLEDFVVLLQDKIEDLKFESENISRELNIQRAIQLENLEKAYNIAKQADIKDYSREVNDLSNQGILLSDNKIPLSDSKLSDGTYLFMLGETYLKAQIDIIKDENVVYPPRYYDIQEQLKQLAALEQSVKNVTVNTFSYQASPNYPVMKDKPKRVIILAIGAILGFFLSCFVLIVRNLFRIRENA